MSVLPYLTYNCKLISIEILPIFFLNVDKLDCKVHHERKVQIQVPLTLISDGGGVLLSDFGGLIVLDTITEQLTEGRFQHD
jgi:hypothetical protein